MRGVSTSEAYKANIKIDNKGNLMDLAMHLQLQLSTATKNLKLVS